jgi:predicted RNA-binding protein with PUA-like domain
MSEERRCWLMKTEPDVFSLQDLKKKKHAPWDGVRNFQARNFMKNDMKVGDNVIFYHSSTDPSGAAGLARVYREAYPDHTSWDPKSSYFDPRSTKQKPLWFMVEVGFGEVFPHFITLDEIKCSPVCEDMLVARKGMRLSVQPVQKKHFDLLCGWGRKKENLK